MIEKTVLNYLMGNLECSAYIGEPERKEGCYVTIEKTENSRYLYV